MAKREFQKVGACMHKTKIKELSGTQKASSNNLNRSEWQTDSRGRTKYIEELFSDSRADIPLFFEEH